MVNRLAAQQTPMVQTRVVSFPEGIQCNFDITLLERVREKIRTKLA